MFDVKIKICMTPEDRERFERAAAEFAAKYKIKPNVSAFMRAAAHKLADELGVEEVDVAATEEEPK